ncbi:response regulator transcription factor [Pseudoflavitalea sp. G-6-1-2]|uniref:response regulator n=1 Tax=Pseudoflavitalea sp. G-6-1-2 TaxID=2728841 RepID=UPI00146EF29E|nr:response regulator transcription factor [Pseudoflavitalea sp. G-6-1-2]NML20801.1 response regulator transcription factor [Pseudoflavitalea sp. G-6-1-2]
MKKVLIADDHFTVRIGIEMLIKDIPGDSYSYEHAVSGDDLISKLEASEYHILITDMQMPGPSGLFLLEKVIAIRPALQVLVLSVNPEDVFALKCLQLGARGFISKTASDEELTQAIKEVMAGNKYMSDKMLKNLLTDSSQQNPFTTLSPRELDVATLLLKGHGVLEVANMLGINTSTASTFKGKIFKKLGISSLVEMEQLSKSFQISHNDPAE